MDDSAVTSNRFNWVGLCIGLFTVGVFIGDVTETMISNPILAYRYYIMFPVWMKLYDNISKAIDTPYVNLFIPNTGRTFSFLENWRAIKQANKTQKNIQKDNRVYQFR